MILRWHSEKNSSFQESNAFQVEMRVWKRPDIKPFTRGWGVGRVGLGVHARRVFFSQWAPCSSRSAAAVVGRFGFIPSDHNRNLIKIYWSSLRGCRCTRAAGG